MIRIFHPVGQGAFYTEDFGEFKIVYDCGSLHNQTLIQNEIRSTFEPMEKIDAVFISHLHGDHVNGLEYLLDYCDVQNVFLPDIDETEKIRLLVYNRVINTNSQYIDTLITNPRGVLEEHTRVIFVPTITDLPETEELDQILMEELPESGSILERPTRLTSNLIGAWVFIPFNFQKSTRATRLDAELSSRGISLDNPNQVEDLWHNKQTRKAIKESYMAIQGGFNSNSMTLYSGPEEDNYPTGGQISSIDMYSCCNQLFYYCLGAGCIYFGDYDAKGSRKWKQFIDMYSKYWKMVGFVQIPHHGSKHNYNTEIHRGNSKVCIMSAGKTNTYRHPHASTVKDIVINGGYPAIVNEDVSTRILARIRGI